MRFLVSFYSWNGLYLKSNVMLISVSEETRNVTDPDPLEETGIPGRDQQFLACVLLGSGHMEGGVSVKGVSNTSRSVREVLPRLGCIPYF